MGGANNFIPDDTGLADQMKKNDRYLLIKQVTHDFWSRWTAEVTPMKVVRQKWHESRCNLNPGDVVLIHEESAIKEKYKLAVVKSVSRSA